MQTRLIADQHCNWRSEQELLQDTSLNHVQGSESNQTMFVVVKHRAELGLAVLCSEQTRHEFEQSSAVRIATSRTF